MIRTKVIYRLFGIKPSPTEGFKGASFLYRINRSLFCFLIVPPLMIWFASHEEVDVEMHCPGEEDFKILNMFFFCPFFFFFQTGILPKELPRYYSEWPCGYEHLQWTALHLNYFWDSTVILPRCQVLFWRHFPNSFCTV